jgi:hypothetical protein
VNCLGGIASNGEYSTLTARVSGRSRFLAFAGTVPKDATCFRLMAAPLKRCPDTNRAFSALRSVYSAVTSTSATTKAFTGVPVLMIPWLPRTKM